jgi:exosortase/archaeosortase family protein
LESLPSSNGVPYWPDGFDPGAAPAGPRPLWVQVLCFLLVFAAAQWLYSLAADTWLQRLFVEHLGSSPAAALINLATPAVNASAVGSRLTAPGGGINIRGGCEGTEVLFLLLAAFATVPLGWRSRAVGLAIGALLVLMLNQVRIVGLFYAYRADHELFGLMHTVVAPVVLVALTGCYFYAWIHRASPPEAG